MTECLYLDVYNNVLFYFCVRLGSISSSFWGLFPFDFPLSDVAAYDSFLWRPEFIFIFALFFSYEL